MPRADSVRLRKTEHQTEKKMADPVPGPEDVFDVGRIRRLIRLMEQHDLAELNLKQEDRRIKLKRGVQPPLGSMFTAPHLPVPAAGDLADSSSDGSQDTEAETATYIKSPTIGTFYTKPNPDSESFVKVGDLVSSDTTVCIIEAMKVFNEIPASISGRIISVLVENEEPVEFGQPLFKVDKNT